MLNRFKSINSVANLLESLLDEPGSGVPRFKMKANLNVTKLSRHALKLIRRKVMVFHRNCSFKHAPARKFTSFFVKKAITLKGMPIPCMAVAIKNEN